MKNDKIAYYVVYPDTTHGIEKGKIYFSEFEAMNNKKDKDKLYRLVVDYKKTDSLSFHREYYSKKGEWIVS